MKAAIFIGVVVCGITYLLSTLGLNWAVKQGFMVTAEFALRAKFGTPVLLGFIAFLITLESK
jgi:hypothetical protein